MVLDWGSVPDWCGVGLTGLGFGAAVYQLREARLEQQRERDKVREEEIDRQEAMARAVGVKIDWGQTDEARGVTTATVEVLNGGECSIDGVVIRIDSDDVPLEIVVGTLLPGRSVLETLEVERAEVVFGELTSGATVVFSDTYGNHWSRTGLGLVREEQPARIC